MKTKSHKGFGRRAYKSPVQLGTGLYLFFCRLYFPSIPRVVWSREFLALHLVVKQYGS
ncbi:MAG: hypothetical protein A4E65_02817 [Syntrophorhabdus sp. PtaU1.Bin153]|nr:MAG: hypothetical protein A4E65_02817 [Syntrophorhabdus sp. PtaU1.Bin153]